MSWLLSTLNRRIYLYKAVQTQNSNGGFDRSYSTLATIWAGIKPVSYKHSGGQYIRHVQINDDMTHEFKVRRVAVSDIGKEFSSAYTIDFDNIPDLNLIKSDCFIFMKQGSSVKGRLFKILSIMDNNEDREYFRISVKEMEEYGTGFPV